MVHSPLDFVLDLLLEHPLVELSQRNTFQATTGLFVVMIAFALVGFRSQRFASASGVQERLQVVVQELPLSVIRGGERLLKVLYWLVRGAGGFLGVASIFLPFYFMWTVSTVYELQGRVLPAAMENAVADLGQSLLVRLALYFLIGVVVGLSLVAFNNQREKEESPLIPGLLIFGASVGFVALLVWQFFDFWEFFWPSTEFGRGGEGYRLFFVSVSHADLEVNLRSQLCLSPLYILTISTLLLPCVFLVVLSLSLLFPKNEVERKKWSGRVLGAGQAAPSVILASVLLTVIAVGAGAGSHSGTGVWLSPQFILLNAIGDILTLLVTTWVVATIYRRAKSYVFEKNLFRAAFGALVVAAITLPWIALDLAFSAMLAVLTVVLSIESTGISLSLREVLYILVGLSPSGAHWDVGGLFYAMHTTFAPTLVFLASLALSFVLVPVVLIRLIYNMLFSHFERILFVLDVLNLGVASGVSLGVTFQIMERYFVDLTDEALFELAHNFVGGLMQALP